MTRLQAIDPGRIIAMHPVAQRLPVHAILLCRLGRERPSSTNAIARRRRTCAPSPHLLAKLRSSDAVRSRQVIGIAALIRCPPGRESPQGYRIEAPRDSEPPRVNVNADWYYAVRTGTQG